MAKGWKLNFKLVEGENVIDLELEGDQNAIRSGLTLAGAMLGNKVQERLMAGNLPDGLMADANMLYLIQIGQPMSRWEGKFLQVVPVKKTSGLKSSINVEWSN